MVAEEVVAELVGGDGASEGLEELAGRQVDWLVVASYELTLSVSDGQLKKRSYVRDLLMLALSRVLTSEYLVIGQDFFS